MTTRPLTMRNPEAAAGLWRNNPGLVQLLGLCPLLAVTTSAVNGIGLGLATLAVLTASNGIVSATRGGLRREIRIPAYVLIIAALVTSVELVFEAYLPALDRALGIFLPLIVTNCAILARAESYASRNPVLPSLRDGLVMGLGFAWVLVLLGALRELAGEGRILGDLARLAGGASGGLLGDGLRVFDGGVLLAVLPPGAFIALALLIAAKNALDARRGAPAGTPALGRRGEGEDRAMPGSAAGGERQPA